MTTRQQDERLNDWLSRHSGVVYKVARSFAGESHDRDDLVQEITFRLWESADNYPSNIAETTWIYRVSLYTAINWSKREKTREKHVRGQPFPEQATAEPAAKEMGSDDRLEWLYQRISELGPLDRSLTLLMLDGMSYQQMAETLGISESNVGVRINRVKKKLTRQLEQENNQ